MQIKDLHPWDLTSGEAIALQKQLAHQVVVNVPAPGNLQRIAGVDVSYKRGANRFYASVVVLDYASLDMLDTATASGTVNFPYVPGLLSFRELPILLQALRQLVTVPDVILVDGQGVAHPRRLGLASHLGLWLDLPTIGCAKSRLCGEVVEPASSRGAWTPLCDAGETIGRVLRTKPRVRPLYLSVGHKINIEAAGPIVLRCCQGYRLPEPTRQAHLLSNRLRRSRETSVD